MKIKYLFTMLFGAMLAVSCMPPDANVEQALISLLNSEEGKKMTADDLNSLRSSKKVGDKMRGAVGPDIQLPITDLDVLPRDSVLYTNPLTGSTLWFSFNGRTDSLNAVGTVTINQKEFREVVWTASSPVMHLQSRGKSLYTLFEYNEDGPEWQGVIIYVYPDADSLLVTHGYEKPERVFRIEQQFE
ncbi:MAG: hypothetical protein IKH26_07470 [Bacteroidaceae bacterium]|nr:hypothetical protein [Bacteroidaceae bacterium]